MNTNSQIPALILSIHDNSWFWLDALTVKRLQCTIMGKTGSIFNEVRPDTPPLWHLPFASGSFWKLMKQTGFPCVQTASVQRSSSRRAFWVTLMLFDTGSHEGANTRTHTHTGQRHASLSFFPGCTLRGRCSPHNSVLSCQNASLLAAAYPVSLIGADRNCSPKKPRCLFYLFLYAHTCRVQWNSLRLRGGTLRISGLTLKMNVCHIKTLHGQGESCACRYGLHQRWAPSEPVRISHSDRVFCLGVILKLFSTPR